MASNEKNFKVKLGVTTPKVDYTLDDKVITAEMLDLTTPTLSYSGSAGQLFSISDDLTGTIFSVNDISGIPSLEVNADGTVSIAEFDGNVGIGTSSPTQKLDVNGAIRTNDGIYSSTDLILGSNDTAVAYVKTSGEVGIGVDTPTNTLDVNGTFRARTVNNATGDFATISATGILQKRTPAQTLADIGAAASSHTHGNITNAGAIGTTSDQVVTTTTSGVLTTSSRSGIDSRSTFPPSSHTHPVSEVSDSTTLGQNLVKFANPGAIRFIRINADNTVTARTAADFRSDIGAGTSSTVGTVTSVGGTGTVAGITLSGTVTSSGNLTLGGALSTPVSTINDSTTVGQNLVKLTNPSAIRFVRINADNSVSALDAATFRGAIGAGTSSTTGTVTSVAAGNGLDFTTITGSGSVTLGTPGTITGATTNSVTATSHTHALTLAAATFNNGGAGAASGTTFDGTTARTISYNTIGAAASSHTHPISEVTNLQTSLDDKLNKIGPTITDFNDMSTAQGEIKFGRGASSASNLPPETNNNANAVLSLNSHTGGYGKQIGFGDNDDIYIRRVSNNTYAGWKKLLRDDDSSIVRTTGTQTVGGDKTFSDEVFVGTQSLEYPSTETVFVGSTTARWHSTLPVSSSIWHDMFRWSSPTYETSTDGVSYSSATLNKNLFSGKENQAITVCTTTQKFARWTWSTGMQYNYANWLVLGHTYSSPTPTVSVTFEVSDNGTDWTTWHTSSGSRSAAPYFYKFGTNQVGTQPHVRVTIENVSATSDVRLSTIRLLTSRWGDQGQGREREWPYNWDSDRNLITYGTLQVATLDDLAGDFITSSPTGVLQKRTASEVKTDLSLNNVENTAISTYTGFDSRYYTETEVDGFAVKLTGDQTITGVKTFRNANAIRIENSSTEDAIILAGRAGGFAGYAVTITPNGLTNSRTITLPNDSGTIALSTAANVFTVGQLIQSTTAGGLIGLNGGLTIRKNADGDTINLQGNDVVSGGSTVFLVPATLTADRTLTLPDATGTLARLEDISGGATGGGSDAIFWENDITITTDYTITTNKNAMTAGPVTVAGGVTVTVPSGSTWTVV